MVYKTMKNKTKIQHNMCWSPLYVNKHKPHGTQKVKTHDRTTHKNKKMSNTDTTKLDCHEKKWDIKDSV